MKKLESKTVKELISLAREWGISGYSKLKKAELIKLLASKLPKGMQPKARKSKPATGAKTKDEPRTKPKPKPGETTRASREKGQRATQAGRSARARASKARLGQPSQQEYVRPELTPVVSPDPQAPESAAQASLPARYGDGRMGLLPRDAHWLYCFWDLTAGQLERLAAAEQASLRVVRLSDQGDRQVQLIRLPAGASSWYVHVDDGDRTYRCDLGDLSSDGRFEVILSSNPSSTPPDGAAAVPAPVTFAPPPQAADGPTPAPATARPRRPSGGQSRRLERMASQAAPAGGLDSASARAGQAGRAVGGPASDSFHSADLTGRRPVDAGEPEPGQRGFWLQMDADVILYGATVPGASVSLAGIPLQLDPQGHFRARFALPDGGHGFELVAASPDASDERRIQVQVERRTDDPGGRA